MASGHCNLLYKFVLATFFSMPVPTYVVVGVLFFSVTMEAGDDDEEVIDGQNIQSSNANDCPSDSRDERTNGTCAFYVLSFN